MTIETQESKFETNGNDIHVNAEIFNFHAF